MMGIVMPETRWAVSVRQGNTILRLIAASSWLFYSSDWRFTEPQTLNWTHVCMNLFTWNSPYYYLLKYVLFLLKHPLCVCVCARACGCVRARMHAHTHTHTHTHIYIYIYFLIVMQSKPSVILLCIIFNLSCISHLHTAVVMLYSRQHNSRL
jgi:dolichol kinase